MKRPIFNADDEIVESLCDLREERIMRLARWTKKGRWFVARFVKF